MEEIKITKDLQFDYHDLMRTVNLSHKFTLKDVLRACMNSVIPLEVLRPLLRCNYIAEYWSNSLKRSKRNKHITYLRVYWWGSTNEGQTWGFDGIGKTSDDGYTVWSTSISTIAHLPIYVEKYLYITRRVGNKLKDSKIDFQPSITLIELLFAIFWEFSFYGSPQQTEQFKKEVKERIKSIDRGEVALMPHEKVKKDMLAKFNK